MICIASSSARYWIVHLGIIAQAHHRPDTQPGPSNRQQASAPNLTAEPACNLLLGIASLRFTTRPCPGLTSIRGAKLNVNACDYTVFHRGMQYVLVPIFDGKLPSFVRAGWPTPQRFVPRDIPPVRDTSCRHACPSRGPHRTDRPVWRQLLLNAVNTSTWVRASHGGCRRRISPRRHRPLAKPRRRQDRSSWAEPTAAGPSDRRKIVRRRIFLCLLPPLTTGLSMAPGDRADNPCRRRSSTTGALKLSSRVGVYEKGPSRRGEALQLPRTGDATGLRDRSIARCPTRSNSRLRP